MFRHRYIDILEEYSSLDLRDYAEGEINQDDWYENLKRTLHLHPELEDLFYSYPIYSYKDAQDRLKELATGRIDMEQACRLFQATNPEDYREKTGWFELEGGTLFQLRTSTLQELTDELLKRIKDNENH